VKRGLYRLSERFSLTNRLSGHPTTRPTDYPTNRLSDQSTTRLPDHPTTRPPDYLPISMLNQLAYCERRFWLMYVCGEMEINAPVLEGTQQHERAHTGGVERDGDKVTYRRVYLWSDRLCIAGLADLIEEKEGGTPYVSDGLAQDDGLDIPWFDEEEERASDPPRRVLVPVEYKRGTKGRWLNDQIQLCAQALCLEERTGVHVERGEIFYWRSRRRVEVPFTPDLRAQTEGTVARAFALLEAGQMPPPLEKRAKCRDCSLEPICLPGEVLAMSAIP
jgi:CRISPR-associated exonuclease Cas4